jgi:hypothetical protein
MMSAESQAFSLSPSLFLFLTFIPHHSSFWDPPKLNACVFGSGRDQMVMERRKVKVEHVASMPGKDRGSDGEGAFVFVGDAGEGTAAALRRKEGRRGREGGREGGRVNSELRHIRSY